MGDRMAAEGYDALCNPLGTLFNPESIRNTVLHALSGDVWTLPMFRDETMGEWRCWWANTRFRAPSAEEARACVQDAFVGLGKALAVADRLFLTLGTNVCYRLRDDALSATGGGTTSDGIVVSNCQRQPDRLFAEDTLSVDDVCNVLSEMTERLLEVNPGLQITFTLSPYRYRKYGWHRSRLSKAVLLLAIDRMQGLYPESVDYFPSYEIMMDELRDYSFYAEDGLHPAPAAVDIIWKRLCE
ncbi:MAG: GSCFA domain-containing protein [Bacteroidaceae bacterium]|nr:GSCFA domain-containing protein [Bacteroidaceae bacterium]